jgi:hypothetical protein
MRRVRENQYNFPNSSESKNFLPTYFTRERAMEVEMPFLTILTRSKEMDCTHPKQSTKLQNRSVLSPDVALPPTSLITWQEILIQQWMGTDPSPVTCCDTVMDTGVPVAENKESCSKLQLLCDGSYFCWGIASLQNFLKFWHSSVRKSLQNSTVSYNRILPRQHRLTTGRP